MPLTALPLDILLIIAIHPACSLSSLTRTSHHFNFLLHPTLLSHTTATGLASFLLRHSIFASHLPNLQLALSTDPSPPWHDERFVECSVVSYAAKLRHKEILQTLLEHYPDVESVDEYPCHSAPLIYAIHRNDIDTARVLFAHAASGNHVITGEDLTPEDLVEPLEICASVGAEEMARLLFEEGDAEHIPRLWSSRWVRVAWERRN